MNKEKVSIELDRDSACELLIFLKSKLDDALDSYASGVREHDVLLQSIANDYIEQHSKVVYAIELSLGIRKSD